MVRSCDVPHVNYIDGKTVQGVICFENAPITDPASFAVAQPAITHAFHASRLELSIALAVRPVLGVEPLIQLRVERAP